MAANSEPVCLTSLATVKKYGDPNLTLSEAVALASELKQLNSVRWSETYVLLLQFSEEALRHGLSSPGTAQEKIEAVVDYQKRDSSLAMRNNHKYQYVPNETSPKRIIKQLQEALAGNTEFIKAAESCDDCEVSPLSPDVELLAARTFMYRNRHAGASDEEAVQAFHKALQYQNGELRTSTEFLNCKETELVGIIKKVILHFIQESIDIIGLKLVKRVRANMDPDAQLPKSDNWDMNQWEVFPLSEVDKFGEELFENQSDDGIILQWGYEQGQKSYRSYLFSAEDRSGRKRYYVMKFRKTVTISGFNAKVKDLMGDNKISEISKISEIVNALKRFQTGKENMQVDSEFQRCAEYLWGRDGKPPALPYFLVAQLYYLLQKGDQEVSDREALAVLYARMPYLLHKPCDASKNFPEASQKEKKKTYTWFLNKPSEASTDFPELRDYSVGQTFGEDYLRPSVEHLQTEGFHYEWSRVNHKGSEKDFTLLYRARPTLERVPQSILEENRIRFDYWQYIREFVFFGGSSTEGTVLAPDPAWIDEAHRNGVAIFGTVFLPPLNNGGNKQDIDELAKPENLQKLVDIAQRLNFDGWFLNVESYESYSDRSLEELKSSIEKMNLGGKTFIRYLPRCDQSESYRLKPENIRTTCDKYIINLYPAFTDKPSLSFSYLKRFEDESFLQYLMFADEPFWRVKLRGEEGYLVDPDNYPDAQDCLWQFFLGENGLERESANGWDGIAKYAKERKL
ncbi:uncharacterized protein [Salminus brasiliensis]|uniref:uncharacterized protein n=1 Tax=Salminus brasiliensis TaxID=930266 RepID=UPI003B82F9D6